jgi:DNA-binding transcriptional LysR family regulator
MAGMEVNVRLLRCLITVIDEGHFGHAAERLYISAPALSQQIRRLERQVGLPLLDRSSHPVRSLPEALEFVAAARAVLAESDRALAIAQALRRRGENRLRIGFVLTFAGRMTRPILDEFAIAAPDIAIELVELGFADQVTAVLDGTVDVSFAVGPLDSNTQLQTDVVLTEPRTLAMAATHPLAVQTSLQIAQVGECPQICVAPDEVTDGWFRWWSVDPRPDGSRPHYGPACHSAVDFLEIVGAGRGVGITAASLGDLFPRPGIAYVPIEDVEHSTTYLCSRVGDRSAAVQKLRHVVSDIAAGRELR